MEPRLGNRLYSALVCAITGKPDYIRIGVWQQHINNNRWDYRDVSAFVPKEIQEHVKPWRT